jgi:hypothetical protein
MRRGEVTFVIDDDSVLGLRPLMMVDIVRYNDGHAARNAEKQRALIDLLNGAATEVGLGRSQWLMQRHGDSELAILPSGHQEAVLFTQFADALSRRLADYNRDRTAAGQVRLRMAIHRGDVARSEAGFAGAAPGIVARLVDCTPLRTATVRLPGSPLAVAVSDELFRAVVLGGWGYLPAEAFVEAEVREKELHSRAWLRVPGISAAELRAALAAGASDATGLSSSIDASNPVPPAPSLPGRAQDPVTATPTYHVQSVFNGPVEVFHIGPRFEGRS